MGSAASVPSLRLAAVHDAADPAWVDFYPEGLPEDWRLAYYAHHWRDLLIPADQWQDFALDFAWIVDLPETLRLYFQVPPGLAAPGPACARLAAALGARLGGLLIADPSVLPAGVVSPGRLLGQAATRPVLAGSSAATVYANEERAVLMLEPEPDLGPAGWRGLLEAAYACLPAVSESIVCLRAGPRELETAETLLRLTGLAWKDR
ncbi:hypothetical protein [Thioalkalivibrio sp.]|uniref:hypothetical protein n=1 Tax=Thioalkalivibrio sp. TaxID=2093813 RepID=UPI003974BCD4